MAEEAVAGPSAVTVLEPEVVLPTSASQRSLADTETPLGYATTRTLERVLSSCGLLHGAPLKFEAADDVAKGGVLLALPALLGEGLLSHTREHYALPPGYYPMETIFVLLALLALVRCQSLEQTRYEAPGEWGRLLGLDRSVNPGLVAVLRDQIIPRLLTDAPQPSAEALQADPQAVRFTVVVDREGFSPALFAELWEKRIAILTYHKRPGDPWPATEFTPKKVRLYTGQEVERKLAERATPLKNGMTVREVRLLDEDGAQGSIHPDPLGKTLTVEIHRLGSAMQDAVVAKLCAVLTETETCYPATQIRLIYRQVGSI